MTDTFRRQSLTPAGIPFDGDGAAFQLACEAKRIDVLIVAPGSLVEQWHDELYETWAAAWSAASVSCRPCVRWSVVNGTPVVLGAALVVPAGWLKRQRGDELAAAFTADAEARARIERLAMAAVRRKEEAEGCMVVDVSADQCGWDLTSYPPARDGRQPEPRHIEVKGRVKGASTVTVTRNEILYAFNQGDKFVLAIVLINPDDSTDGPYYIRNPFDQEPGWGVASINYNLSDLLARAERA